MFERLLPSKNKIRFDLVSGIVQFQGKEVRLQVQQSRLLEILLERRDRNFSHSELKSVVWQGRVVGDNSVAKLVSSTRKKLSELGKIPISIETLPKRGYRLVYNKGVDIIK